MESLLERSTYKTCAKSNALGDTIFQTSKHVRQPQNVWQTFRTNIKAAQAPSTRLFTINETRQYRKCFSNFLSVAWKPLMLRISNSCANLSGGGDQRGLYCCANAVQDVTQYIALLKSTISTCWGHVDPIPWRHVSAKPRVHGNDFHVKPRPACCTVYQIACTILTRSSVFGLKACAANQVWTQFTGRGLHQSTYCELPRLRNWVHHTHTKKRNSKIIWTSTTRRSIP